MTALAIGAPLHPAPAAPCPPRPRRTLPARINWADADQPTANGTGGTQVADFIRAAVDRRGTRPRAGRCAG